MSPNIDAPYLWIRPIVIILHLSIVAKNIILKQSHNYGVWNQWQQKLLYCICYTIWIDGHMFFGLEQEASSLIAPTTLASRNKRRNPWVGWCVSSWWPLFPSRSSVLIYIYIHIYICIFYTSSVIWRIYIQQECRSVLVKLNPITFYRTVFLGSV